MKTEDRPVLRRPLAKGGSQTAPLLGTDRLTRPGRAYIDTVVFNEDNQALYINHAIVKVLNDALDHKYFFVRGVEVDYRYVMTTSVKDLIDMIAAGELRRSEVIHG